MNKLKIPLVICALSLVVFVGMFSMLCFVNNKSNANLSKIVIVLDAGHGGRDGGSVGLAGTIESDINLVYVKLLETKLSALGYSVVLTRKNSNGLYSHFSSNKKISDMNKRMEIIKKANPSLVISIHMNSFSDRSVRGAVVYHKIDDSASIKCSELIQQSLYAKNFAKNKNTKSGDFFMLNCSYYSSVLIECGYLSNPEEEKLLNDKNYQNELTDAICDGVFLYFGKNIK